MTIKFDSPKHSSSIIKVIGVGGGGSNAVNYMYSQGIKGVDFILTNTDKQALETSSIPNKIQLGSSITEGWGAGAVPETGRKAAEESIEEIKEQLKNNTKMVFITAGMGGGTGTGAAPVIAQVAREMGLLTVGIVTLPFSFEGRKRMIQAKSGLDELRKNVDTLLIICNDKLRELHGDLKLSEAFHKADNILTIAAKGIAEIITVTGYINVDFNDVNTVMRNSGVAIMGTGIAEGENRALKAVEMALSSPLLNDNDITGAQNILLYLASGKEEISMDEVTEITDYIQNAAGQSAEIIWGNGNDDSLENNISVTLIATGFSSAEGNIIQPGLVEEPEKIVRNLNTVQEETPVKSPIPDVVDDEMKLIIKNIEKPVENSIKPVIDSYNQKESQHDIQLNNQISEPYGFEPETNEIFENVKSEDRVDAEKEPEFKISFSSKQTSEITSMTTSAPEVTTLMEEKRKERIEKLKKLSYQIKNQEGLAHIEKVPAYQRRNVTLDDTKPSSESEISPLIVNTTDSNSLETKKNHFLHDNVD